MAERGVGLPILATVVVLSGALAGADCRSKEPTAPLSGDAPAQPVKVAEARPPDEGFTAEEMSKLLPGVDTSMLTPKERSDLNDLANDTFCPCASMTVAGCVRAKSCPEAVRELELAKKFLQAGVGEPMALLRVETYYASFARDKRVDVEAKGPTRGNPDAKVTLVEFSDFQCPACRAAQPNLEQLVQKYPNDVRWVFRNFPLPMHDHSLKAATCGVWAYDTAGNDKFWALGDQFFGHQDQLDDDGLVKLADAVGLDGKAMLHAVEADPRYLARVQADKKTGEDLQLAGTPTIYLNGRQLVLPPTFEMLSWTVEDELEWQAKGGTFTASAK